MIGPHLNILSGFAFNSKQFNDQGDGMPLIRIRDVGKDSSETFYSGDFDEKFIVKSGDILIGMDGDFRLAVWQGESALLNQRVCKIESKGEVIDRGYLIHMLPRELQRIEDSTSYATVKHLSVKKIKAIEMPLPPLEEQKRIAEILDEADRVRKKTQALIDKYDELAQSIFDDFFMKKNEFDSLMLSQLGSSGIGISDGNYSAKYPRQSDFVEKGVPFIRANNLSNGSLNGDDLKFLTPEKHAELRKGHLETGDVLISTRGSIGQVAMVTSAYAGSNINSQLALMRPPSQIMPQYLVCLFKSNFIKRQFSKLITGTALKQLPIKSLKKIDILVPSLEVQKSFVNRIEICWSMQEQLRKQNLLIEENFNALLQKAFKGELT